MSIPPNINAIFDIEFERCIEKLDERSNTISNAGGLGAVIHAGGVVGVVARLGSPNTKRSGSPAIHRVASPNVHRIGSPNVHKIKEKGKKKGASIKVKVEDSGKLS